MAKKKARKKKAVTAERLTLPRVVTDADHTQLSAAHTEYCRSDTAHNIERLFYVMFTQKPPYKPQKWELEQIRAFIKKFQDEFETPLAKALE